MVRLLLGTTKLKLTFRSDIIVRIFCFASYNPHMTMFSRSGTVAKEAQNKDSTRWLCYLAFDILHDGTNALTERSLSERRKILEGAITNDKHHIEVIEMHVVEKGTHSLLSLSLSLSLSVHTHKHKNTGTKNQRHRKTMKTFAEMLHLQHEGLILKRLDTNYIMGEASRKKGFWVKLKPDYIDCMSNTLDLVLLGAYYSKGSSNRKGLTCFLMGVRSMRMVKSYRKKKLH